MNFTKRGIDLLPTPKEKRARYLDDKTRGLGLLIYPSGEKVFYWYRKVAGAPVFRTIGNFTETTVERAREKADEYNNSIAEWKRNDFEGPSPLSTQNKTKIGTIFDEYLKRLANQKGERAELATKWQFEKYLSAWRERTPGSISAAYLRELHAKLSKENGKVTANRVIELARRIFNYAIKTEIWDGSNPATKVELNHESSRERFLDATEVKELFAALVAKETPADLRDFVLLALLTGARRGNVLGARWEQFDLDRAIWRIPKTSSKNRKEMVLPLVPAAITILKRRRNLVANESLWVFPSKVNDGHLIEIKKHWQDLIKRAGIQDFKIHDLRRTYASWQALRGIPLQVIGQSLGHSGIDATQVYARLTIDPVRNAAHGTAGDLLKAGKVSRRRLLLSGGARR